MLARSLGAPMDIATEAASFAEMYYAMCSFTDDVQDGDAADYMLESDERILINTLAQLICITTVRGIRFASNCPNKDAASEMSKMFLNGGVMLRGQFMELKRENWSTEAYKTVACLSGGRQFDVYFKTAAMAAGISAEPFLRLSDPVGILVQIWHDKQSNDERLIGLPANEVSAMIDSALLELEEAANEIPSEAKTLIENMKQYVVNLFQ